MLRDLEEENTTTQLLVASSSRSILVVDRDGQPIDSSIVIFQIVFF